MSAHSTIEWTDATWNPVTGCTKVSPGCTNCYAETFSERWRGVPGHPYQQGFDLRIWPDRLALPLSWKKPRRIFVNSMSDLFHEGIPEPFIDRAFATMRRATWHQFQVLTKRTDRMAGYVRRSEQTWGPLRASEPHIWLGASVETQRYVDRAAVVSTPAALRREPAASGAVRARDRGRLRGLGLLSSGLIGVFLLGIFTRRASAAGALVGAASATAVLIYVTWFSPLHFYLYAVVGITTCVIVGYLASLVRPGPSRDLAGLTRFAPGAA